MGIFTIISSSIFIVPHEGSFESRSDASYLVSCAEIDAFVCSTADHPHIVVTSWRTKAAITFLNLLKNKNMLILISRLLAS